eukprot:11190807-Lingulodinium_polyedra.AAC.1
MRPHVCPRLGPIEETQLATAAKSTPPIHMRSRESPRGFQNKPARGIGGSTRHPRPTFKIGVLWRFCPAFQFSRASL